MHIHANVLDYFGHPDSNPFYERESLNERQKQEGIDPERLKNYEGVEYAVSHAQDPVLQVIRKQLTQRGRPPKPLAYYYVARGNAFQAPDVCSVVSSRLASTMFHLRKALSIAREQVAKSEDTDAIFSPKSHTAKDPQHDERYRPPPTLRSRMNMTSEHVLDAGNRAAILALERMVGTPSAHQQHPTHAHRRAKGGGTAAKRSSQQQAQQQQQQQQQKRASVDDGTQPTKRSKQM
ncbi:hypothetical protein PTSG_00859 [Salpingoeca rosetta]|uniref:Mediator of RNA polymerase II transcription subunit 6 n=1 Tax=Salpingoeca rosetta (strain ATCC 50818 / BSB-021) TaxID=946362 RepID=F2TXP4_SALR5|nr:uncharacterized protein PTSG_00859 [Salpingoeca rosetta]EGD76153.1 hypothetical protein PTSG_00859 [Salpingoeca rosetta]|eukprot:XP_004998328.1 hypothetical protein PTSG_00859 [Salpingoeca rosetta]